MLLVVWAVPARSEEPLPVASQNPSVERVRDLLTGKQFKEQSNELIRMGAAAFPAYETILVDPVSLPRHIARIFIVLCSVKENRARFLDSTVRRLADADADVRGRALLLLEQIGSEQDIPPVVALLSDTDTTISYRAATVLLALGNLRSVTAIDVWLNSGNHREQTELRQYVTKCRDDLKQRLEKPKEPKK